MAVRANAAIGQVEVVDLEAIGRATGRAAVMVTAKRGCSGSPPGAGRALLARSLVEAALLLGLVLATA